MKTAFYTLLIAAAFTASVAALGGCSTDQTNNTMAGDTNRAGRPADINSGDNKNTDDLNGNNLQQENVGPNYKMNGADNSPPRP